MHCKYKIIVPLALFALHLITYVNKRFKNKQTLWRPVPCHVSVSHTVCCFW